MSDTIADNLVEEIKAALKNVSKERAKDGDDKIVLYFLETIRLALQKLVAHLDTLAPHVEDPEVSKFEAGRLAAIALRVKTMHAELDALTSDLGPILVKVKAAKSK